ncbi:MULTISPECIES: hypothetical protein [unclassified Streptomyces]|uniref:hypothetical protein n=1 Tax=unclassified Streptomyces TaxID=2593676 RepID=UPI00148915B7|nr:MULTISPECIES: hypothetical protein [unclassified Streptomyces]
MSPAVSGYRRLDHTGARNSQASALVALAHALAVASRPEEARSVAGDAWQAAVHVAHRARRTRVFTVLAGTYLLTGDAERATRAAEETESTTRAVTRPEELATSTAVLARALASIGDDERAERTAAVAVRLTAVIAGSALHPMRKADVLTEVSRLLAAAGRPTRCEEVSARRGGRHVHRGPAAAGRGPHGPGRGGAPRRAIRP